MNKTIETLVRILDEERIERIGAASWKTEYDYAKRRNNSLSEDNDELRIKVRDLETRVWNATKPPVVSTADLVETMRLTFLVSKVYAQDDSFARDKIPFVKAIREESGLGLKEAKDLADAFLELRNRSNPGL